MKDCVLLVERFDQFLCDSSKDYCTRASILMFRFCDTSISFQHLFALRVNDRVHNNLSCQSDGERKIHVDLYR